MSFIVLLPRRPISQQNKSNPKYKDALRTAATERPIGPFRLEERLYCRILWFHRLPTRQDVDNIVKPIFDALKGVIFEDDYQVSQCLVARINLEEPYRVEARDNAAAAHDSLLDMINANHNDILYIEVGNLGPQLMVIGQQEGGS